MSKISVSFFILLIAFILPLAVFATDKNNSGAPVVTATSISRSILAGSLSGTVVEAETGDPVSFAYVHLEGLDRSTTTDRDGRFQFQNLPAGAATLYIHRIGYVAQTRTIEIVDRIETEIQITLVPTVITGESLEVTARNENTTGSHLEHASIRIAGEELRGNLGTTLSETLNSQPGITQRTMGAAAGRPVIRGLGDERVLILQDGESTGDVSWASADHAVTLDPSSAQEIEIARGPAALEYGANAIGGVVNVVSNRIPNTIPTRPGGAATIQGTSVNRGLMGAGSLTVPWNDMVFNADINGRTGGNFRSPSGEITNTGLLTTSSSIGGSYVRPWGYAGLSGSLYYSEYGIPPDLEGGHPSGVDIEMVRYQAEGRSEILIDDSVFNLVEIRGNWSSYNHSEIESGGIVGTEYGMLKSTATVKMRYTGNGILGNGVVGITSEAVDFSVFGSGTPNSNSYNSGFFAVQENDFGSVHLETGLRLDHSVAKPDMERPQSFIGNIRKRSFTSLSGSVSAIYDMGKGLFLGSTMLYSYRPPSLEELYSEGPHLASYSFEIGNPELDSERGLGSELFTRFRGENINVDISGYYNRFNNFIHAQDTGEQNEQHPDLNNYQFVGTRATLYGVEFSMDTRVHENLSFQAGLALTIGNRVLSESEKEVTGLQRTHQPLPMIPPASGMLSLTYRLNTLMFTGRLNIADKQSRTGEFETPTEGYETFDFNAQYRFDWGGTLHTLSLNVLNLFDEEYYSHLSRIKDIFPEPGRSVNLLYRVYF